MCRIYCPGSGGSGREMMKGQSCQCLGPTPSRERPIVSMFRTDPFTTPSRPRPLHFMVKRCGDTHWSHRPGPDVPVHTEASPIDKQQRFGNGKITLWCCP